MRENNLPIASKCLLAHSIFSIFLHFTNKHVCSFVLQSQNFLECQYFLKKSLLGGHKKMEASRTSLGRVAFVITFFEFVTFH